LSRLHSLGRIEARFPVRKMRMEVGGDAYSSLIEEGGGKMGPAMGEWVTYRGFRTKIGTWEVQKTREWK